MAPDDADLPADQAKLEAMLKGRQYGDLFQHLQNVDDYDAVTRDLNWERKAIFEGQGILISLSYMNDLWRVGEAMKSKQGDELKQTAVAMALYTYALIQIDGLRCTDRAAVARREAQLFTDHPHVWKYAAGLSTPDRLRTEMVALVFEAGTSPARMNDDVLCTGPNDGSMLQLMEGMVALQGKMPEPTVGKPGTVGKTIEIPRAPPGFRPADQWATEQDAVRTRLPDMLDKVLAR